MSLIKEKKKKHGSEGKKQLPTWAEVSLIRPESFTFRHLMSGKSFKPEFFAPLLCVPGFSQVRKCNPPKHISELLKNENCVWWWQQRVLTHRLVFFFFWVLLCHPRGAWEPFRRHKSGEDFSTKFTSLTAPHACTHTVHKMRRDSKEHASSVLIEMRLKTFNFPEL